MSKPYPETVSGELLMRSAPGPRHETICSRLHQLMRASVANLTTTILLPPRTQVRVAEDCALSPDLALITIATGRLWLAAEIVNSEDHRTDTVIKKQVYEEIHLPRLWMIDPRYDNVEVYHASSYGLALKQILAGKEVLTEKLLPEFEVGIMRLFESSSATPGQ
jgi:Uma2 family endonuclease